jgi:hypothetical protein
MRNPKLIVIGLMTASVPTVLLYMSVTFLFLVPLSVGFGSIIAGCIRLPERLSRSATAAGSVLCLAAAIGPFALEAYAHRSGAPIKFVLPAGYRGEFSIVKNRAHGLTPKLQNGAWVFEFPAGGVLVVNDDSPFCQWHQETYTYSDGHPADVEGLGSIAGMIQTGPNSWKGSGEYDGTTYRWRVIGGECAK